MVNGQAPLEKMRADRLTPEAIPISIGDPSPAAQDDIFEKRRAHENSGGILHLNFYCP